MKPLPKNRAPWIRGDRPLPRAVRGPVHDFLQLEVAGGGILLVATLAALVVANSSAAGGVEDFFAQELTVFEIGQLHLVENDRPLGSFDLAEEQGRRVRWTRSPNESGPWACLPRVAIASSRRCLR